MFCGCGLRGPAGSTDAEAIAAWNLRPARPNESDLADDREAYINAFFDVMHAVIVHERGQVSAEEIEHAKAELRGDMGRVVIDLLMERFVLRAARPGPHADAAVTVNTPDISKIQELAIQRNGHVDWIYFAWIDGAWVDLAPFGNRMPERR